MLVGLTNYLFSKHMPLPFQGGKGGHKKSLPKLIDYNEFCSEEQYGLIFQFICALSRENYTPLSINVVFFNLP